MQSKGKFVLILFVIAIIIVEVACSKPERNKGKKVDDTDEEHDEQNDKEDLEDDDDTDEETVLKKDVKSILKKGEGKKQDFKQKLRCHVPVKHGEEISTSEGDSRNALLAGLGSMVAPMLGNIASSAGQSIMGAVSNGIQSAASSAIDSVVGAVSQQVQGGIQNAISGAMSGGGGGGMASMMGGGGGGGGGMASMMGGGGGGGGMASMMGGGGGMASMMGAGRSGLDLGDEDEEDEGEGEGEGEGDDEDCFTTRKPTSAKPHKKIHKRSYEAKKLVGSPYETKDQAKFPTSGTVKSDGRLLVQVSHN